MVIKFVRLLFLFCNQENVKTQSPLIQFDIIIKRSRTLGGSQKEVIESITDLNLNAIMFKNTFDEMVILHHNKKIGGGLLNPQN